VWDLRAAHFDLSAQDVRKLAEFAADSSPLAGGWRMAFVLAGELEYGLARMLGASRARAGIEVAADRDLDEARAWVEQAPAAVAHRSR
jgi:hypothetical protein